MGLAVADSPFGPFRRIKGDGTMNDATPNDPPLISTPTAKDWNYGYTVSSQGTLFSYKDEYYIAAPSYGKGDTWGIALAKAVNNNPLGPFINQPEPLIPASAASENAGMTTEMVPVGADKEGYYFMVSNAVYASPDTFNPKKTRGTEPWHSIYPGCGNWIGVGTVLYWAKVPTVTWDINNSKLLASAEPNTCNTTSPWMDVFTPKSELQHRVHTGLGWPIYVPEEKRLYIYYNANDFARGDLIDNMFRDIFMVSIDMSGTE